jgi:hypothetical protein
MIVWQWG